MRAAGHIMLLSRARVPLKERPELQNLAVLRVDLPHKLAEIHRERRQARAGVVAQGGCAAAHPTCRAWDDAIRLQKASQGGIVVPRVVKVQPNRRVLDLTGVTPCRGRGPGDEARVTPRMMRLQDRQANSAIFLPLLLTVMNYETSSRCPIMWEHFTYSLWVLAQMSCSVSNQYKGMDSCLFLCVEQHRVGPTQLNTRNSCIPVVIHVQSE